MYFEDYSSNNFIEEVRVKVLESLFTAINTGNNMIMDYNVEKSETEQYKRNNGFKAFIEKGNHGSIVKTMLNRRSWWSIQEIHDDNYETSDFIWTQWLKQPI